MDSASFDLFNPAPATPVILSAPHAGRNYGAWHVLLRVPPARLVALEDRHVDQLLSRAVAQGIAAIVARAPRLWIDLNRAESDLDPAMVAGARAHTAPSVRTRGGLGLIPRRLSGVGDIWRAPLAPGDVAARIVTVHRPYHAALAGLIEAARARFGAALLLDVHSMPPIDGRGAAQIVIGDRFGVSAGSWLTDAAQAVLSCAGLRVAVNAPYSGGHILARHAAPERGVHALQIEVDRRLYLDAALDGPGAGLAATVALIARLAVALGGQLGAGETALAAE